MRHLYNILWILLLMIACNHDEIEHSFVGIPYSNATNIRIHDLEMDSLLLDSVPSSYIGELVIYQDTIFFVDAHFCFVFMFDPDGVFLNKTLGQGKGPKEINIKYIDGYVYEKW